MGLLRFMRILTTFSILFAALSVVWQTYVALMALNNMNTLSLALLKIESNFTPMDNSPPPRVAVGYGACLDLLLPGAKFLTYKENMQTADSRLFFDIKEIADEQELLVAFGYYFKNGAAAERIVPDKEFFDSLIDAAKKFGTGNLTLEIGGNAPLMSMRFLSEGAEVMLGASMSSG